MTSTQELARALQAELRGLADAGRPNLLDSSHQVATFTPAQAKAMLRIEASLDTVQRLIATDERWGFFDPVRTVLPPLAPRKFVGVTLYPVDYDLPAPGWRIVNPMKVR